MTGAYWTLTRYATHEIAAHRCLLGALTLMSLITLVLEPRAAHGQTRFVPKFSLEQITKVKTLRDCAVSVQGTLAACTVAGFFYTYPVIPRFGEGNNLRLISLETGEIRQLTSGENPKTRPLFSPSGEHVAFESEGDIWVVRISDGNTKRVTLNAAQDSDAAWSPDGRALAFVSNRRGQTDLWLVSVAGESEGLSRLTDDSLRESDPQWSPDGSVIVFTAKRSDEYYSQGLFSIVVTSEKHPIRLTPADSFDHSTGRWSPDGKRIAFLSDRSGYMHVWTMNADGSDSRRFDTGQHDSTSPHWRVQPVWSPDGRQIQISRNREGSYDLLALSIADHSVNILGTGPGQYHEVGWARNGLPVYIYENAWSPPDLYIGIPETSDQRQLTFSSHASFRRDHFAELQRVSFESFDGLKVKGFLMTPPDLKPGERLPAIVNLHPNGYGQFYDYWDPFLHFLTRSGYIMLLVDWRGSSGYGREFRRAQIGAWGTKTLEDVNAASAFIRSQPFVDPDRVAVMGLSFGGLHAVLALTKTPDVFRAGVNMMGPMDYRARFSHSAYRAYQIGATFDEDPALYNRISPITSIRALKAPLLVLHSEEDRNVPPEHTYRLIEQLERHGKAYEVKVYPGEAHGLADPVHQLDAYDRIVRFLERHLKP